MEIERGGQKLYASMRLWELPDQYVIEPTDGVTGNILIVSRADGSMKLVDELPHCSSVRVPKIQTVYGVMGMLKLLEGSYLFVITERQNVGSYLGHPIFRVSSMKILPCDLSLSSTPAEHKKMETEFSALLNAAESTTGLFFSYGANLTLSAQRLHGLGEESKLLPLWRQADPRYMWNNYMMELLIDNKHGAEGRLSEMYGKAMEHIIGDDIRYVHFDFHKICGHIHFERLSILYEQIEDFLKKNGYFLLNDHGKKLEEQHGVVRTNCIDCLDRTNVTQSMIGRKMLESQLRRICVFDANETISSHPNFDEKFKIMWANHGDDISIQYSGTPALKGDFVRCGQRTMQGIVNDGCNALARYYLNNFCDGTKQDAMDLLHGHFIASVSRDTSPHQPQKSALTMKSLPVALSLALAGFFFALMSLRQVRYDLRHVLLSIMWASLSVAIALYVRANGRIFCNRPRLHKRRF